MNIALANLEAPVRLVPSERLTTEAFFQFSAANQDLRLEMEANGDVIVMTPTLGGAGVRGSLINRALGNWADTDGRGFVLDSSTGCLLPDGSVLSPDTAWISSTRWTPPPVDQDNAPPCPDFVIELRSKTDRLAPARSKMKSWIANGAELAWLIDPARKVVEIYRPGKAVEVQEGHTAVYGEGPVGGFVLELARIWA